VSAEPNSLAPIRAEIAQREALRREHHDAIVSLRAERTALTARVAEHLQAIRALDRELYGLVKAFNTISKHEQLPPRKFKGMTVGVSPRDAAEGPIAVPGEIIRQVSTVVLSANRALMPKEIHAALVAQFMRFLRERDSLTLTGRTGGARSAP